MLVATANQTIQFGCNKIRSFNRKWQFMGNCKICKKSILLFEAIQMTLYILPNPQQKQYLEK